MKIMALFWEAMQKLMKLKKKFKHDIIKFFFYLNQIKIN